MEEKNSFGYYRVHGHMNEVLLNDGAPSDTAKSKIDKTGKGTDCRTKTFNYNAPVKVIGSVFQEVAKITVLPFILF